jgi:hypothetical protein
MKYSTYCCQFNQMYNVCTHACAVCQCMYVHRGYGRVTGMETTQMFSFMTMVSKLLPDAGRVTRVYCTLHTHTFTRHLFGHTDSEVLYSSSYAHVS